MNATRGSLRMPTQLINFQRQFQVWLYTVSLRQLLLRSNRSETHATRIDIHFMDVEAIQLPTIFYGVVLAEASQDDPVRVRRRKVFTIQSPHFFGYVVAGVVGWHEDENNAFDESYFQKAFLNIRV